MADFAHARRRAQRQPRQLRNKGARAGNRTLTEDLPLCPGQPLPGALRQRFETALDTGLDHARIHHDAISDHAARGELLARHTCTLVATSDGFLTRQELDRRFEALRGGGPSEPLPRS